MAAHYAEKADVAAILGKVDSLSARVDSVSGCVDSLSVRVVSLGGRLDGLEIKVDRIPWFILASWLTMMLALVGGLYFR